MVIILKKETIWLQGIKFDKPKQLKTNKSVDVLIVGGGITGLSTAYHLRNSNLNICLVEKNLILHGITSKTTGKLTFLQGNIYTKLKDKAKIYYNSQKDAIKIVEKIIKEHNIDCDYENVSSYLYTDQISEIDKIKKEEEMLKALEVNYKTHDKLPLNIKCKYAISVNNTAVFHPIKYLVALKNIIVGSGIEIYENSSLTSVKKEKHKYICIVNNKKVVANKVVIASHYPFFLSPLYIPIRTYIEKSYILANKTQHNKNFSAITVSKPTTSIRYHEDNNNYLIYLSNTHNLCNKYNYQNNFKDTIKSLEELKLKANFVWSNHDIITEDNLPYIGFIDDDLLIATGYNAWGMTNGSLAGKILSDLILGKKNKYKDLFDPKRNKGLKNTLKYSLNVGTNIKSFSLNKLIKNKSWYSDNIIFTKKDGKSIAIYIDKNNKKHIVYNICPHLKCSLIFNEIEKTWDCPCHGSRFNLDGKCIIGPSKYDIGYKK